MSEDIIQEESDIEDESVMITEEDEADLEEFVLDEGAEPDEW